MRRRLAVAAAVTALTGTSLAAPALASSGGDSTVTFTVAAGTLSISMADYNAVDLAPSATAALAGADLSGGLPATTVNDTRGLSTGWTVSIKGTDFSSGSGTVPVGAAAVSPGVITGSSVATAATATPVTLTASDQPFVTAVLGTGLLGVNSATYTPTVTVKLPSTAAPGTYTGTITQSVQ